jgi:hypothetical protein
MCARHWVSLYALVLALGACATAPMPRAGHAAPVVFVCEHGAAKSVVAAAYFNRMAEEKHLSVRAVARGLTPQEELSTSATLGLRADGLSPDLKQPVALNRDEAQSATRLISFLPLPHEIAGDRSAIEWDDVPATGDGYDSARDTIVAHVEALVDELATSER